MRKFSVMVFGSNKFSSTVGSKDYTRSKGRFDRNGVMSVQKSTLNNSRFCSRVEKVYGVDVFNHMDFVP